MAQSDIGHLVSDALCPGSQPASALYSRHSGVKSGITLHADVWLCLPQPQSRLPQNTLFQQTLTVCVESLPLYHVTVQRL